MLPVSSASRTRSLRRTLPLLAVALAACAESTAPGGVPAELTELPRALTPAEQDVRDAANRFAFTLFEKVNAGSAGKNVFISPLSVSMALGMTMNGADGATLDQMRQALGFGAAELGAINAGYRDLAALLGGLDATTSFQIANSIWHERTLPVVPAFLTTAQTFFDAEVRGVDFADNAGTTKLVNDWVNAKTNGRIPTILQSVQPNDVMYLINAIWFKGSWRGKFDPRRTGPAPFHAADGTTQSVPMMNLTVDEENRMGFRWAQGADYTAGELPYGNGAFAMTIVVPSFGTDVDAWARGLTRERWDSIVGSLAPAGSADIALPKFTLTFDRELKEDLQALGMADAFGPGADFSRLSSGGLFIDRVTHKAFVQVDEEGTVAAAVTSVVMNDSARPGLRVDRPFVFAIRERLSGTVLFIGKVGRIP